MAEDTAVPSSDVESPPQTVPPSRVVFPVVGIGASAGGLAALKELFRALPVDTGMAFVVVQHLAPDMESNLAEILGRETRMPVAVVGDEPAVERDHVYVIPPGRDMITVDGRLQLIPQQRHVGLHGIDRFFRSLAEDAGHLAVGVVLSGGLNDGTLGLEEIKAAGGVTFAQDRSAEHASMPRSAIASGCVDYVLPPEGIAQELVRFARHPYLGPDTDAPAEAEPGHARITEIVRRATGVDFTQYKKSTLQRRIKRRMMLHRYGSAADYEEHLRRTPEEIEELYQDILISVTSFFRNPDAFDALARDVFPKLISACPPGEKVRLWVVGCSSGEEAYSLAICFTECAQAMGVEPRFQLFATDVNQRCVEKARAAWYPRSIENDLSPEQLRQFFVEDSGGYRLRKALREHCVFSRHNACADPPFLRMDFLSCRNLLIYLEPVLQQKVVQLFHYALKPGGWMWLGSSESAGTLRDLFDVADARHKIYNRRVGGRTPSARFQPAISSLTMHEPVTVRPPPAFSALPRDAERVLLAKYAPPGVVVSGALEIVQFQGDTGPYLAPAAGAASLQLLKMLREGLPAPVKDALQKVEQSGAPLRLENLRVRSESGFRRLAVEVMPVKPGPAGKGAGFIVLFDEAGRAAQSRASRTWLGRWWQKTFGRAPAPSSPEWQAEEIAHLREELATARDAMHATLEQHEAAMEELQSANEEAQSANEEMQSIYEELENSKAEVEATNKELTALTDELASRNAELNRVNEELRKSEHLYRAIGESIQYGVWICGPDGRNTYASESFLNLVGLTQEQCSNMGWGDVLHPDDVEATMAAWLECVRSGQPWDREHRFHGVDGRWHHILARGVAVRDDSGQIVQWAGINLDISRIKEAEAALKASEQKATSIVQSIADGLLTLDKDWQITYLSQRGVEILAPLQRTEHLLGMEFWKAFPEAAGTEIEQQFHRAMREQVPVLFETYYAVLGQWFDIRAYPSPLGLTIYFLNITERKQASEALRESEAFKRSIIESSPDCVKVLDLRGRLLSVEAGHDLFGTDDVTPYIGRSWIDFWQSPEDHAAAQAAVSQAAAGGKGSFIGFFRTLKGVDKWWNVAVTPVRNAEGLPTALLAVSRDVTDNRLMENALRESEARKDAILSSALDAIITMDHEGLLTEFNPAAERIFGYQRKDVIGRSLADLIIPEQLRERHRQGLAHFLATGEGPMLNKQVELPAMRADGTEFPAEFAIIHIPGTRPPMFTAFLRDITQRRRLEDSLVSRAEQLAQADRSKDEFLAMLAHELRNPLAPLRNATELLKAESLSEAERAHAQQIISHQIENMSRMLEDLLDVSRITEGKIEMRKKPVALESIITAALSLVRPTCAAQHQELSVSLPDEPLYLDADATRLEQVFGNLLANACKYSGEGSHISLSARRVPGAEPPEVIVIVRDDGIGIAPELLPRIFDLFVQASRTLDRSHGGLGIGLTLVQRLVKLHGGSIEAHSEGHGQGAEFIVHLPLLREVPAAAPLPPAVITEVSRRILIVDDNTDSARTLAMLLGRRGHHTCTAFTGPDALTTARAFKPEVVLLDIGLPGMDGFEVARQIRTIPGMEKAVLIAMSGYGSAEDRATAKAAGFDDYMVKPIDLNFLRARLAQA